MLLSIENREIETEIKKPQRKVAQSMDLSGSIKKLVKKGNTAEKPTLAEHFRQSFALATQN